MKHALFLLGIPATILFTGCGTILSPTPADTVSVTFPNGQTIRMAHRKDMTISHFQAIQATNGSVSVSFDALSATNNPAETIGALAGEAQRDFVIFQGMNNLVGQLSPLFLMLTNGAAHGPPPTPSVNYYMMLSPTNSSAMPK